MPTPPSREPLAAPAQQPTASTARVRESPQGDDSQSAGPAPAPSPQQETVHQTDTAAQAAPERAAAPSTLEPQPQAATEPATPTTSQQIDLREGHLVAFFRALLAGRLSDQRVDDGTPGYTYNDRRGEALVPFGYFMDFGRKSSLQFVDLQARWIAEGLLGPRVSVIVDGRAVNCLNFTRQACRMLPPDLQAEVSRRFRKVSPESVRVHGKPPQQDAGQRREATTGPSGNTPAGRDRGTRPPSGQTPPPAPEGRLDGGAYESSQDAARAIAALPFLPECLDLVRGNVRRFEGHPDYAEGGDQQMGRWRHVTRSGEELLLVRRDVLAGHIDALGGRPETVFALWRAALVLRGESDDRIGFRTSHGGQVYLAFRWQVLRQIGFPGRVAPDGQDGGDRDASPYGE